jgi:hypothetical protein
MPLCANGSVGPRRSLRAQQRHQSSIADADCLLCLVAVRRKRHTVTAMLCTKSAAASPARSPQCTTAPGASHFYRATAHAHQADHRRPGVARPFVGSARQLDNIGRGAPLDLMATCLDSGRRAYCGPPAIVSTMMSIPVFATDAAPKSGHARCRSGERAPAAESDTCPQVMCLLGRGATQAPSGHQLRTQAQT